MIGVILAAGMAKRLRPLTDNSPKCLLRVGERSLLQRTVDALIAGGIDELVVVTGYLRNLIEDFLKANYPQLKISFIDNPDYATTNNIYSLWLAIEIVGGKTSSYSTATFFSTPKSWHECSDKSGLRLPSTLTNSATKKSK